MQFTSRASSASATSAPFAGLRLRASLPRSCVTPSEQAALRHGMQPFAGQVRRSGIRKFHGELSESGQYPCDRLKPQLRKRFDDFSKA